LNSATGILLVFSARKAHRLEFPGWANREPVPHAWGGVIARDGGVISDGRRS